jgi:hypothetical protein
MTVLIFSAGGETEVFCTVCRAKISERKMSHQGAVSHSRIFFSHICHKEIQRIITKRIVSVHT